MTRVESFPKGKGIVKDLYADKQYGFIRQDDGTTIFFHANGVCNPSFEDLREGYEVEYMITDGTKGLKAIGVAAIL